MSLLNRLFGRPRGNSPVENENEQETETQEGFVLYGNSSFYPSLQSTSAMPPNAVPPLASFPAQPMPQTSSASPSSPDSFQSFSSSSIPSSMFKVNKHLELLSNCRSSHRDMDALQDKMSKAKRLLESSDLSYSFRSEKQVLEELNYANLIVENGSLGGLQISMARN